MNKKIFFGVAPVLAVILLLTGCVSQNQEQLPTPTATPFPQPTQPTNIPMSDVTFDGLHIVVTQTGYGYPTNNQLFRWGVLTNTETSNPTTPDTGSPPPLVTPNDSTKELNYDYRVIAVKFTVTNNSDKSQQLIALGLGNSSWVIDDPNVNVGKFGTWLMDNNYDSFHQLYLNLTTIPDDGWGLEPGQTKELNLDFYVPPAVDQYAAQFPDHKMPFDTLYYIPNADGNGNFSEDIIGYAYLTNEPVTVVPSPTPISTNEPTTPSPTPSN